MPTVSITDDPSASKTVSVKALSWQLLETAKNGSPRERADALEQIYDCYYIPVRTFILFRVGRRMHIAEDLASEVFVRLLHGYHNISPQANKDLGAWLMTVARNLANDHHKSGRYRLERSLGSAADFDEDFRIPSTAAGPGERALDYINNVTLMTAVKKLNPEQKECIILRFLKGFTVEETAKEMGKTTGAIKALQSRAVSTLRRLLPKGFER